MKKMIFLIIPLLFNIISCSQGSNDSVYHTDYTVRFVNYNGAKLYETTVKYGETAVYAGPKPVRPAENFTTYVFKGWDRDLTNVTYGFTTKAVYEEIVDKNNPEYTNITKIYASKCTGGYDITRISTSGLKDEELVFPDYYEGEPIVSLGRNLTKNTTQDFVSGGISAKRIKFPKNATIIGVNAFWGYKKSFSFKSIELPEECREVRDWAFRNNNVGSITLNDKLETIGELAFSDVGKLKSLVLNKGLKSIGYEAFAYSFDDNASISIYIPDSVTYIGKNAFYDTYEQRNEYGDYETLPVHITFYCEAESKPSGWDEKWNWYGTYQYYNQPAPAYDTYWGVPYPY